LGGLVEVFVRTIRRLTLFTVMLSVILVGTGAMSSQAQDATPTPTLSATPLTCDAVLPLIADHLNTGCNAMGKDQVCIGNGAVTADYYDPANPPKFSSPGDIAPISAFKSIVNSPLNLNTGEWGVTVFKAQAIVPGATNGQVVTFVLYGDTNFTSLTPPLTLTPTATTTAVCSGTTKRVTVLHGRPASNGAKIDSLPVGTIATIRGRTDDSQWLFVEANGLSGWVSAQNLDVPCDLAGIPVLQVGTPVPSKLPAELPAMKAFYFSTGTGQQSACSDIPSGGLLIQSPPGQKVTFTANGVDITIGSTVVLRAIPNQFMGITVLTGSAEVSFNGQKKTAHPGERIRFNLGGSTGLRPTGGLGNPTFVSGSDLDLATVCQIGQSIGMEVPCVIATPPPTRIPSPTSSPTSFCTFNVQRFSASPNPVAAGQSTTISWDVDGIQTLYINGRGVTGHSSMTVTLNQTTTYTLLMNCGGQQQTRKLTVTVTTSP
jgi:hypothetical protein